MSPTSTYLRFSPIFVGNAVKQKLQVQGLPVPVDVLAQVEAALKDRGYKWLSQPDFRQAAEKAREYSQLYSQGQYEPFLAPLADFRRAYMGGTIPKKTETSSLETLQEKDDLSYQILAQFWNDLDLSAYGSAAVTDFLMEIYAQAFLKHPMKAKAHKIFWTLAPKEYDFAAYTRQVGSDTIQDSVTNRQYTARQIEIIGDTEQTVDKNAEHQKYRYQSGMFDLSETNPLDDMRKQIRTTEERKRQREEHEQKKQELIAWLLDSARTAEEVRSRRQEAYDFDLTKPQYRPEYVPAVYDRAKNAAEERDEQKAKEKKNAEAKAAFERRYPLLIPKAAPLRFLYQYNQKAAESIADDVLAGVVTLKAAQNIQLLDASTRWEKCRYFFVSPHPLSQQAPLDVEQLKGGMFYSEGGRGYGSSVIPEALLYHTNVLPVPIPKEYAPTRTEAFEALPKEVRAAIKIEQKIRTEEDVKGWPWESVEKQAGVYGYKPNHWAKWVVFAPNGAKMGANTIAHRAFVAEAEAKRKY